MYLDPSVAYFGIIFSLASRVLSTTFGTKLGYVGVGEGWGGVGGAPNNGLYGGDLSKLHP